MNRRLTRSSNKVIAGVCSGLANYSGLDVSLVRIGFVLVGIFTAIIPISIVYLVMWFIVPQEDSF